MNKQRWYRHDRTGQRGYLVETADGPRIRIDNPAVEITRPLGDGWEEEADLPPINERQIRMVAFEADRALCRVMGLHREAKREWIDLKDEERIKWNSEGPPKRSDTCSLLRRRLYECTVEELTDALKDV
jgi:hypothetical protein